MLRKDSIWYQVKEIVYNMEIDEEVYKDDIFYQLCTQYDKTHTSRCIRLLERIGVIYQNGWTGLSAAIIKTNNFPIKLRMEDAHKIKDLPIEERNKVIETFNREYKINKIKQNILTSKK